MYLAYSHDAGIRVILDVVYNHTGSARRSVFDRLVPRYYFRFDEDGSGNLKVIAPPTVPTVGGEL